MKKHFTLFGILISFLSFQISFSQIEDSSFDPAAESVRLAPTPTSPEAQAFTKYGNTPVNMYTGTPNIQIPIYTHKGRELDLPISLTYDASGIKVEQLATNVGLGWNLNVGGRISRITNGMPDDFSVTSHTYGAYKSFWDSEVNSKILTYDDASTNPYFNSKSEAINYLYFLKKSNDNEYDIQPDYYSFSALGQSDMFVIDVTSKTPEALNNPRIKVSITKAIGGANTPITKWVVTMDDGTIYTFEETEVTQDTNFNDIGPNTFYGFKKEFNSSWLLTKIESANGKDIYDFTYTDLGFWTSNSQASSITGVTNVISVGGAQPNPSPTSTDNMGYNTTEYKIRQKVLSEIKHNSKRIVDVNLLSKRWDMSVNSAIEKINIYNKDTGNNSADLYKSYTFEYDYFRTSFAKVPPYNTGNTPGKENIRLKLDKINIKDSNSTLVKDYQFDYIDPYTISSTASNSQDYYGYNNGVSNSVLYPKSNEPAVPSSSGANRNPNFSRAKRGLLEKITYPTGGHTFFEFEKNYEKEATGTSTVWQTAGSTALAYPTLPSYNATACNASFWAGNTTPQTTSDVFEVTQNNTDFKMIYDQTGNLLKGYNVQNMASLIKISSIDSTKIWTEIYDNNCGVKAGIDLIWSKDVVWVSGSTSIYPSTSNITLDAGFYQMVLANPSLFLANSLEAKEGVLVTNYVYNQKAGVRVKSIKDYTDATTLALHKSYEYPSGTVISMPDYDYYSQQYTVDNNNTPVVSTLLHRLSYASGTDKPHMGYSEVIEKVENANGTESNGTTSNRFNTSSAGNYRSGVYTYYINGKETAKNYSVSYYLGKTKGNTVYDSQGLTESSSSKSYYDLEYYSNTGLYLSTDESKSNLYPIPTYSSGLQKWYISYTAPAGYTNGIGGSVGLVPPAACNDTNIFSSIEKSDLCNPGIARLVKRTTTAWGKVGNITQSISNQYSNNAVDYVNQITDYTYYDQPIVPNPNKPLITIQPDYLLKETSTTNSSGETIKQEFLYASNVSSGAGSLKSNNMLSTVLETKTYKDNVELSEKKTIYSGTVPSKIQTLKGTQSLEDRLLFERFENDNLVQVKQADGTTTAYIWGYDNRYIIAKVENATYADIEGLTAFGLGFTITGNLSPTQENELRGLPNVLVTTFDYDPIVGVTSIKDPRKNVISYEYDDFHRLKYIKDRDGKILSENQYNYGPQN